MSCPHPILWHGIDGSLWDLTGDTSPVQIVSDVVGLLMPNETVRMSTAARVAGGTYRGSTIEARTLSFKLEVGDPYPPLRTGGDWLHLDSAWWSSMATDALGVLQIGERTLRCRLSDVDDGFSEHPAAMGRGYYTVELLADQPFWELPVERESFVYEESASDNFFGGTAGKGPPFIISRSQAFKDPRIHNPGDQPAFPRWRLVGPMSLGSEVGVGSQRIRLPFRVDGGQEVLIDTNPLVQTITDGSGVNLWPQMGHARVEMAPVPIGGSVPIVVDIVDAVPGSAVHVEITPLARRAW